MWELVLDCRVVSARIDGLSRYALGLAGALAADPGDFRLTLIVPEGLPDGHPLERLASAPGVRAVRARAPAMALASHALTLPMFRALRADVYHYPHFNLPLAAPRPAVVTIHDVTPFIFPTYFESRRAAKRAYFWLSTAISVLRAAAVIVPSEESASALARTLPVRRERIEVVHEGVDETFARAPSADELAACRARHGLAQPYLLYVGVSRPHKNIGALLRAFASVATAVPHDLVLVGQAVGPVDELRALASRLDVTQRVRWLGYVSEAELRCLYGGADGFVLCSLFEGFGLGVIEAMASGTPVVVSREGAAAEVAGGAGLLVDPRSERSIAAALREVCTRPELRDALRRKGLERAASFTWRRAAERTRAVYERVVAHGP